MDPRTDVSGLIRLLIRGVELVLAVAAVLASTDRTTTFTPESRELMGA